MEEITSLDDVLKEALRDSGDLLCNQAAIRIEDLQKDVAIREKGIASMFYELRTLRADKERLDWLECEPLREECVGGWKKSLFRQNQPITRAAIDAAKEKT